MISSHLTRFALTRIHASGFALDFHGCLCVPTHLQFTPESRQSHQSIGSGTRTPTAALKVSDVANARPLNSVHQRMVDFSQACQAASGIMTNATDVHVGSNFFFVAFDPIGQILRVFSNLPALNLGTLF